MLSVVRSIQRGFDTSGINEDEEVRDKLLRLFDHENLVRIMDIQLDKASGKTPLAQLGFEHMSRGTLNRILFDKVYVLSPLFPHSWFCPFFFSFYIGSRWKVLMRKKNLRDIFTYVLTGCLCVLHRAIPESLCWHVLEGVTNALLWLHYGYQQSYKDEDWNPIALINIHPGASMFSYPSPSLSPPLSVPFFSYPALLY